MKALFLALLLVLAVGPVAAQRNERDGALEGIRALDQRVAAIAHRLATGNLDLCADRQFLPGFSVHDLSQYDADFRPGAIRLFTLDAGPAVLALAPSGPAERSGLRRDDVLLTLEGRALPRAPALTRRGSFEHVERILAALEAAFADGRAAVTVRRAGSEIGLVIGAEQGCASRFELIPGRRLNAKADGRYVQVTSAIAAYVRDDDELAAVLAHEFAHNILRHRLRLDAAGVRRGFLGSFGRNARRTRETELEADRLAPYLLERAGYDPDAAVRFWRRFGNRGLNIFGSPTHGGWSRRAAAIQSEIVLIRQARAEGRVSAPAFVRLPLPPLAPG